ncbi:MAG: lamin tail domain-containing protein [Prolixibacteraceae bacterium]|jgi:hypothetical protein|nr:lamin tail domain-containing protein [Prolixibacteraceae bacterium]
MRQLFFVSCFVFILILSSKAFSQYVWHEKFDVPDKGYWANEAGELQSDLTGVNWNVTIDSCNFEKDNDYAKTVSTSGGRFEVLDSDGEAVWFSASIDISEYDAVSITLDANETGSSDNSEKKYIKASYILNGGEEMPFYPEAEVVGNWGSSQLIQSGITGESIQIVVRMNSSYSSDKLYIDNILVAEIDSLLFNPEAIVVNESPLFAFSSDTITIRASVVNVNSDLLIDTSVVLNIDGSNFEIVNSSYENGFYIWEIVTPKNGELFYSISDQNNALNQTDQSILFFSKEDAKLIEDFESDAIQGWDFSTEWELSTIEPIAGNKSVKHIKQEDGGSSILIQTDNTFNLSAEEYFFSFKIKNTWIPSTSNNFYVWLKSNSSSIQNGGYAIGINAIGSSKMLSVWSMKNSEPNTLIAETTFEWIDNIVAQIDVIRSPQGKWILNVSDLNSGAKATTSFIDVEFTEISNLELVFNYTKTRSGLLWFDDLIVIGQNAAPFISAAKTVEEGKYQIIFNEKIEMEDLTISNFKLAGQSGDEYAILSIDKNELNSVVLTTEAINEPNLIVSAYSINDLEGKTTAETFIEFENALPSLPSDVIITEIMADPNPPESLPEAEYIEIFNRSNKHIQLENYILFVRNTEWELPRKLIAPNEHLILCDPEFESIFSSYGSVLAIPSFPSILNSGATIAISNHDGVLLDQVSFTDNWYNDRTKENGGYSLERIDNNRFCGDQGNWTVSLYSHGGTPGKVNSVEADNSDNLPPELLSVDIVSDQQLELLFNESLDTLLSEIASRFTIPGLMIASIEYSSGENTLLVNLRNSMKVNFEYQLTVFQLSDECGNVANELSLPFTLVALEPGDILINEVLFNPYTGGADFVELYNNSGLTIDIADLKLATRNDSMQLQSIYNVSTFHASFKADGFMAFSKDTANILENYYVPFPEDLKQM